MKEIVARREDTREENTKGESRGGRRRWRGTGREKTGGGGANVKGAAESSGYYDTTHG